MSILQQRLTEHIDIIGLQGGRLEAADLDGLVRSVQDVLKVPYATLVTSLEHLVGFAFSAAGWYDESWRLAGNVRRLRQGLEVRPWKRQDGREWSPVQLTEAWWSRDRRSTAGTDFTFFILAGSAAGLQTRRFWPSRFCAGVARRAGFSAPWGEFPYHDPREMVGFRLYVQLDPEWSGNRPGFRDIRMQEKQIAPSSCWNWNRQLLRDRQRSRSGIACPLELPVLSPCHLCIAGRETCDLAPRGRNLVQRRCRLCRKQAWFDPASPPGACLDCLGKGVPFQS